MLDTREDISGQKPNDGTALLSFSAQPGLLQIVMDKFLFVYPLDAEIERTPRTRFVLTK